MRKDYYVYVYLNQTTEGEWKYKDKIFKHQPFYVGKGTKKRDEKHLFPSSLNRKSLKNSIIKSILRKTGENPIHIRIYENLTEKEAVDIEIDFISVFGRRDKNTGILSNCTDGGDGVNNLSDESKKLIGKKTSKKVYQYDLEGNFIKEWSCILDTIDIVNNPANISTAIKRKGTCAGFIWKYEKLDFVDKKIKYQMPVKYENIKQYDKKGNYLKTFKNINEIKTFLNRDKVKKVYECINNKIKTAYGYKWQT